MDLLLALLLAIRIDACVTNPEACELPGDSGTRWERMGEPLPEGQDLIFRIDERVVEEDTEEPRESWELDSEEDW